MKIGLVIDDTLDRNDGVQQYVILIGKWLQQQGHTVHYLTSTTKRTDIKNIHSLSRNIRVAFNKNILSVPLPASNKTIKRLLHREKFDILHVQMPYSPFLAAKIVKYASRHTALVGTFHIAPHTRLVSVSTQLLGKLLNSNLKRFHSFMSVSSVAQRFAEQAFGIKSKVVPNAIDIKKWQLGMGKLRDIDVVFLGRLVHRKGCEYFLKSLSQTKISFDSIKVVGDGPERKSLERYARQMKLHNIAFTGYVSEDKKQQILNRSKIAIFPSTGGESFGIVLLEAMAAGAVTVAGNNAGYKSVLGDVPESLVTVSSPAIAKKLDELFDNAAMEEIRARQQRLVEQYDVNKVGNDIMSVYKQAKRQLEKQLDG